MLAKTIPYQLLLQVSAALFVMEHGEDDYFPAEIINDTTAVGMLDQGIIQGAAGMRSTSTIKACHVTSC